MQTSSGTHPPRSPRSNAWRRVTAFTAFGSGLEWLYLGIGLFLVHRHRWFFDDSFIYYRYVDNLLFLDAGLTYNAGEFVEGYTSPLHCLLLVALRALHLSYPAISLCMGLGLFAVFWALLVQLGRDLAPRGAPALNFPLALLATNYSVTSFFTAGNEGALMHVAAAATAGLVVRPGSRGLTLLAALSPLVRPELALSLGLALAYLWWRTRRVPLLLIALTGLLNGAWLLFRIYYYADLLPNTFYLKHLGSNFESGFRYLVDTTGPYHVGPIVVFFTLLAFALALRARRRGGDSVARLGLAPRAAMLAMALAVGGYVVRGGGSAMHYYYLAAPFTLVACSLAGLAEAGLKEFAGDFAAVRTRRLAQAAMLALALLGLNLYPAILDRNPLTGAARMARKPSPAVITDPAHFRGDWSTRIEWPAIEDMTAFAPELHATGYRDWFRRPWCHSIYRNFDQRSVHRFGLTDAILARVDTPERKRGHKPGLRQLAWDMVRLQQQAGSVDRGLYRRAVERRIAPPWVVRNLETIELIERKMYNRHDLGENVRLAFQFPPKIALPDRDPELTPRSRAPGAP